MNCELAHERIALAIYGELADDQAHELNRHLTNCTDCQQEQEQVAALKLLADSWPVTEPDANLIARSRLRLEEALDALPPRRWYGRIYQQLRNCFVTLESVPVASCLLLLFGAGAGLLSGYQYAQSRTAARAPVVFTSAAVHPLDPVDGAQSAEVENISSILRSPNSDIVEVHFNQIIPRQISGSLHDPSIRQLLMLASENSVSAGVRDDSVGLLADQCRSGVGCEGIRDALLIALHTDPSPTVRLKALNGLSPYIAQDTGVRDAVLETLLNDSEPRIRSQAVAILVPVEGDTSVRQVLSTVASSDQNLLIRTASRKVLRQVSEIQ